MFFFLSVSIAAGTILRGTFKISRKIRVEIYLTSIHEKTG